MNTAPVDAKTINFMTDDLPFAAYLHASRKLRFIACQEQDTGRMSFIFDDPKREGEWLQVEFESGAECAAATFYDSIRHLRRVMDRTRTRSLEPHEQHSRRR
jgi:hypothetical protein